MPEGYSYKEPVGGGYRHTTDIFEYGFVGILPGILGWVIGKSILLAIALCGVLLALTGLIFRGFGGGGIAFFKGLAAMLAAIWSSSSRWVNSSESARPQRLAFALVTGTAVLAAAGLAATWGTLRFAVPAAEDLYASVDIDKAADNDTTNDGSPGWQSVYQLRTGQCVDANPAHSTEVVVVPCTSGDALFKVTRILNAEGGSRFPGQTSMEVQAYSRCPVGNDSQVVPTQGAWEGYGITTITCLSRVDD